MTRSKNGNSSSKDTHGGAMTMMTLLNVAGSVYANAKLMVIHSSSW